MQRALLKQIAMGVPVKELKELLSLVLSLTEIVVDIAVKKSGTIGAIIKLLPIIPKIAPAVQGLASLGDEIRGMSEDDKEELKEWIAIEFDLSDDEVEGYIEMGLSALIDLSGLLQAEMKKRGSN